ncbi:TonB-dependent receptor [Sphingorhabdus sp. Alg239-R122]|uniref:TonB-dependent receptor n=1 Tax=Sphingorhabdus sp. Alg239-R122 TaxID=2305989 RepID=UPI001F087D0A|nr:TonB-dependent receptor [Sphingorhabdus sp. Alg239-R122]
MAMPAVAQEQDSAKTVDDDVIIVTATRRAQDVQDIPIAVTAVGPVQLEAQNVANVTDIGSVAPSFNVSSAQAASNGVVLRIRGVGTTSNNIGFESAVGVFIDGAYQSRPGVALSEFVDVERVEVLRGPQGTLFGRNTSAGALNIINNRPDVNEFGGFANASYGSNNLISVQGAINVPLVQDTLALRVTGAYRKRDGYLDVVDGTGNKFGETNDIDRYLLRGQLGFESDGGIKGRLIVDYAKDQSSCCGAIELLRSPIESAGLFGLVGLGLRGGMASPDVATNPFDVATAEHALDNRIVTLSRVPSANVENWGVTGEVEVPLGDAVDLIYIGSYREYDTVEAFDSDFSALDAFNVDSNRTTIETMTHELRLQGDAFAGSLNWLVGVYYSDETIRQDANLSLGADYGELVGATLFGPTMGMFGANPLTVFSGGFDPSTTATNNLLGQDSESFSVFTHNVFSITDSFDLTLGLRYSDESKTGFYNQASNTNPVCSSIAARAGMGLIPPNVVGPILGLGCFPLTAPADLPQSAGLPLPRTFNEDFSDEELIYTAKLGYDFGNVNAYASFTHGYKSGGLNLDVTAAVGGASPAFASEEVDAYELGLKGRFIDGAVTANIAVFYEEFTDFQVLEFTGTRFQTFNVPKVISSGFEFEGTIRPTDGLTFTTSLAYTDARYPNDCAAVTDALAIRNLCGNSLTNAPEFVAIFGANYEISITDSIDIFFNGQARMESDRRTSTQASAVPATAAQLGLTSLLPFDVQDGTTKINLRAGVKDVDGAWALEAWVTNLTDEVTRGVTFNTALRSGSRSAFPQEPRMYGLTLRGKF